MGQKTVLIIGVLTGCAMCCSLGGAFMSMHKVSFFTGYIIRAVRLETKLLMVEVDDASSDFCRLINAIRPGTCDSGTFMLQDVAQRFCAPVIEKVYPQACLGFHMAYYLGMVVLFALAMNAALCVTGVWLLYQYVTSEKHRKSYRQISFALFFCGTLLLVVSLIAYGFFVFKSLDEMRPRGFGVFGELVFKPSGGQGLSWGYLSCILNVALQVIAMALFPLAKTSQELDNDELAERKLAREYGLEPGYGAAGGPAGQMLPGPGVPQQQPPVAAWGFEQPGPGYAQAQVGFPMQQPIPPTYGAPGGW